MQDLEKQREVVGQMVWEFGEVFFVLRKKDEYSTLPEVQGSYMEIVNRWSTIDKLVYSLVAGDITTREVLLRDVATISYMDEVRREGWKVKD